MNRDPFTEQITLTPDAVETLKKIQQKPGIKVNTNLNRLKEGERVFKAAFIDTEYPTVEDEEKLRKLWQAKAFTSELKVLPYKETQENLAKNVFITPEDQEFLAQSALQSNIRQIVDFGLARKSGDKDEDQMTCTITCKMTRDWMERFLRFLNVMQEDGIIGHSETLSFFADGDGTFRPKFTVTEFKKED